MSGAAGRARTSHSAKYIRQLCKHWSHKLEVEQSGATGLVRFSGGTAAMAATDEELTVTINAEDEVTVERLKDVVTIHLNRFAFREAPLLFKWSAQ